MTELIKCPFCGATMVGTRTTNKLKDGTKKSLDTIPVEQLEAKVLQYVGFTVLELTMQRDMC